MRLQTALATVLLPILVLGTALTPGCRQAPTAADFNGGYRGNAQFLNSTGRGDSVHEWSIDSDPTGRMMAAVTLSMSADDNAHGYDFGGDAVKGDTDQLLGLIDDETGEFVAAETEEPEEDALDQGQPCPPGEAPADGQQAKEGDRAVADEIERIGLHGL